MIGGRLPDIPDPTKIASSGAEAAKAAIEAIAGAGADIAKGVEQILLDTIGDSIDTLSDVARDVVKVAKKDIDTGRTTIEKVRLDIDRAANRVLSQVDQALGQEIVRKFKSEIERHLK